MLTPRTTRPPRHNAGAASFVTCPADQEMHRAGSVNQGGKVEMGDAAGWVAAIVAIGAALIALRAAKYSRRQADAAEGQAGAAREQVELMRRQMHLEERDRHQQDAPRFKIDWYPTYDSYDGAIEEFWLAYEGGAPTLDRVALSLLPDADVIGFIEDDTTAQTVQSLEFAPMSQGVRKTFHASLKPNCNSIVFAVSAAVGTASWEAPVPATDRGRG